MAIYDCFGSRLRVRFFHALRQSLEAVRKARAESGLSEPTPESDRRVVEEFLRCLPQYAVTCFLLAEAPALQRRFQKTYRENPELKNEAEDIAEEASLKLLKNLRGNWPRKHVGGYLKNLAKNVGQDALRKRAREKKLGRRQTSETLINLPAKKDVTREFLEDLSPREQSLVMLRLQGLTVEGIAEELKLDPAEVQKVFDSLKRRGAYGHAG